MLRGTPDGRGGGTKPSIRQFSASPPRVALGDLAHRVQGGVGVAGAELDQQVAAGLGRVEVVVGERLHRLQPRRLPVREPEALVEQRVTEARP